MELYLLFADDLVLCAKSAADLQKPLNGLEQLAKNGISLSA